MSVRRSNIARWIAPIGLETVARAAGTISRIEFHFDGAERTFAAENLPLRAIDLCCSAMVRITAGFGALFAPEIRWGAWQTDKNTLK
jgi:hypothetical protein